MGIIDKWGTIVLGQAIIKVHKRVGWLMEQSIKRIIHERQLVSSMNKTKWRKLIEGIATLPFEPAFQLKVLEEQELLPPIFSKHLTYLGDWQHLEIGIYSFTTIEWIRIRPYIYRYRGKLMADERQDISLQLEQMLLTKNIPFEKDEEDFIIFGYIQSGKK